MKKILTNFAVLGKKVKFALAAALMTATLAVPAVQTAVTAQNNVALETYTFSENVSTTPDSEPSDSTSLKIDEVARVYTWFHNRQLPDSGLNAEGVKVKINIPTAAGKAQQVNGTVSADNAAAVSDATTINLPLDRSKLEVEENSAIWRYNKGAMDGRDECQTGLERVPKNDPNNCYTNVSLSASDQAALLGGNGWTIPEHLRPCFAYESSVSVQVRSVAEVVRVDKYVREIGSGTEGWTKSLNVEPNQEIEYLITFTNQGNKTLNNVVVADNLPKYHDYLDNTVTLSNSKFDKGQVENDEDLFDGGFNSGDYAPTASGHVIFRAQIKDRNVYERCGEYLVRNVGFVNPDELEPLYSTAEVKIKVVCEDQPEQRNPVCTGLTLEKQANRSVKVNVTYDADGTTFKNAKINFGDGSDELTTNNVTGIMHTYDRDGTFMVTAVLEFQDGDQTLSRSGEVCKANVTFTTPGTPETPETPRRPDLPNTGAGDMIGLFASITIAGSLAHKFVYSRRLIG